MVCCKMNLSLALGHQEQRVLFFLKKDENFAGFEAFIFGWEKKNKGRTQNAPPFFGKFYHNIFLFYSVGSFVDFVIVWFFFFAKKKS